VSQFTSLFTLISLLRLKGPWWVVVHWEHERNHLYSGAVRKVIFSLDNLIRACCLKGKRVWEINCLVILVNSIKEQFTDSLTETILLLVSHNKIFWISALCSSSPSVLLFFYRSVKSLSHLTCLVRIPLIKWDHFSGHCCGCWQMIISLYTLF